MLIAFKGPCGRFSGYSKVFLGLAQRLQHRLPLEIQALNNEAPSEYPLPICQVPRARQFGILIGYPLQLNQLTTDYKILYTMYEATDMPDNWKSEVKRADEVWVPSRFCYEVFAPYNRRTRIVPFGFDESLFFRRDHDTARWRRTFIPQSVGRFLIGTAGVMSKRKGIDILTAVFERLETDATLAIKTRDTRWLGPLPPNTVLLEDDWPDETVADFYRSLDAFVLPTRGEGWGLPPLEAAACGTPVLVTRATGPADYVDERGVFGIDCLGYRKAEGLTAHHAEWAIPNPAHLLEKLRSWCDNAPVVEHGYRQWSMAECATRFEGELLAATRRAQECRDRRWLINSGRSAASRRP